MAYVKVWGTGPRGRRSRVLLAPEIARRVRHVVARMADHGQELILTEGLRPVGQRSDQYARSERDTSTGGSTQWYQYGRYLRGETPSAINPDDGPSKHNLGQAIDWDAPTEKGMSLRASFMAEAGMAATVASESWHAEVVAAPRVKLRESFLSELPPESQGQVARQVASIEHGVKIALEVLGRLDVHRWREEQQPPIRRAVEEGLRESGIADDALVDRIVERMKR